MVGHGSLKSRLFVAQIAIVGLLALTTCAYASGTATATANASATVIAPIAISKDVDLDFGQVVFKTGAGTVVIATTGTRSTTGSGVLGNSSGTAAQFTVTGEGTDTYAITLPTSDITITDGGSNNMKVNTFVSNPATTGALTGGTQTLLVGATLNSLGSQAAGSYTGTFDVSVVYN